MITDKGLSKRLYETHYMRVYSYVMTLTGQMQTDADADPLTCAAYADASFRIHLVLRSMEEPYKEVFELL